MYTGSNGHFTPILARVLLVGVGLYSHLVGVDPWTPRSLNWAARDGYITGDPASDGQCTEVAEVAFWFLYRTRSLSET